MSIIIMANDCEEGGGAADGSMGVVCSAVFSGSSHWEQGTYHKIPTQFHDVCLVSTHNIN